MPPFGSRLLNAVKQALSLEGLVALGVGLAVTPIIGALVRHYAEFSVAVSALIGLGCGLLAGAAFVWWGVIPQRDRAAKDQQERDTKLRDSELHREAILRNSVRGHLRDLAAEGRRLRGVPLSGTSAGSDRRTDWKRRADSLLVDAFGKEKADEILAGVSLEVQAVRLLELSRAFDDVPLRADFRGWRGR